MSFSLETLGLMILTLLAVGVGVGILTSVNSDNNDMHPVENSLKRSDYPVCQEFEDNQTVDREGFRTLLYARHLDVCETANNTVELGFRLEKEYIETLSKDLSESPQVIYREGCEEIPGLNGFVVEETSEELLGSLEDKIIFKGHENVRVCQG